MKALDLFIYRGDHLTLEGRFKLPKALQHTLDDLVRDLGLLGAVDKLRRLYPPRLLKNSFQVGLTIDARLYLLDGLALGAAGLRLRGYSCSCISATDLVAVKGDRIRHIRFVFGRLRRADAAAAMRAAPDGGSAEVLVYRRSRRWAQYVICRARRPTPPSDPPRRRAPTGSARASGRHLRDRGRP
jgi:hypothetical protein